MKAWRNVCLTAALIFLCARLFTGVVYESDDPTAAYVLKHEPSLFIEHENFLAVPMQDQFTILYSDENELLFEDQYDFLMQWAFGFAALFLVLAYLFGRKRF
jgi:hypothetical protein